MSSIPNFKPGDKVKEVLCDRTIWEIVHIHDDSVWLSRVKSNSETQNIVVAICDIYEINP